MRKSIIHQIFNSVWKLKTVSQVMLIAFIGFHRLFDFIEHPVAFSHGFIIKYCLTAISDLNLLAKNSN
jgi:hypothetical protein